MNNRNQKLATNNDLNKNIKSAGGRTSYSMNNGNQLPVTSNQRPATNNDLN